MSSETAPTTDHAADDRRARIAADRRAWRIGAHAAKLAADSYRMEPPHIFDPTTATVAAMLAGCSRPPTPDLLDDIRARYVALFGSYLLTVKHRAHPVTSGPFCVAYLNHMNAPAWTESTFVRADVTCPACIATYEPGGGASAATVRNIPLHVGPPPGHDRPVPAGTPLGTWFDPATTATANVTDDQGWGAVL